MPIYTGTEYAGLGDLNREWNQLEEAAVEIQKGIELAKAGDHIFFLVDVYLARVRLALAQKDWETVWSHLQKAEQVARRCPTSIDNTYLQAWQARLQLAHGNLAEAARWAETKEVEDTGPIVPQHEFELLTLARIWLAQGRLDQAAALLKRVQNAAENAGRHGRSLEAQMLRALVDQAAEKETQAVERLSQVLTQAEPEGYVRWFLDEGAPMAKLLYKVSTKTTTGIRDYAGRLLAAYYQEQAEQPASQGNMRIGLLSKREIEVLRLMAGGCANKEIASQLVISLGTVKRHVIHIFQKLDAANRTQAVAIARELEII
jgi:LuxR family maltose regulon positive regulatory protein